MWSWKPGSLVQKQNCRAPKMPFRCNAVTHRNTFSPACANDLFKHKIRKHQLLMPLRPHARCPLYAHAHPQNLPKQPKKSSSSLRVHQNRTKDCVPLMLMSNTKYIKKGGQWAHITVPRQPTLILPQ